MASCLIYERLCSRLTALSNEWSESTADMDPATTRLRVGVTSVLS